MTRRSIVKPLALALAALSTVTATAADAVACGGEWYPEIVVDPRIDGVARTEKSFDKGKHAAAAAAVIRMMPHVRDLNPKKSTLVARGMRVLAVAIARENGALPVASELPRHIRGAWLGEKAGDREANLAWAVQTLRTIDTVKQSDPASRTDLAEALARVETHRAEARTILEELAKKDLVATPEGYAVLAELRRGAGDQKGVQLALQRCEAMAQKSEICHMSKG
jgi:uncharacterized protein (DUF2267 family)